MVFDIDEISEEGLDFKVQESKNAFEIDQPECALCQDVTVAGRLEKVLGDIYFSGQINTELSLMCSRCLERFNFPVATQVTAHFVSRGKAHKESPEIELHPSDIDIEYYDENVIDLIPTVHDQILLTVPLVSLCKPTCRGLCPQCGKNWNLGDCSCHKEPTVDPRLEVLKSLKNKIK